jgi:hypothetical protein
MVAQKERDSRINVLKPQTKKWLGAWRKDSL